MYVNLIVYLCLMLFSPFSLAAELADLSVIELQDFQQDEQPLVVDIRTEAEWQATGIIPGSQKLEFFNSEGHYDLQQWLLSLNKLKTSPDQPVVLVCRSGNRSQKAGTMLTKQLGLNNIYHLQGGIKAWHQLGQSLVKTCTANSSC